LRFPTSVQPDSRNEVTEARLVKGAGND
jgi:hypothetical protein